MRLCDGQQPPIIRRLAKDVDGEYGFQLTTLSCVFAWEPAILARVKRGDRGLYLLGVKVSRGRIYIHKYGHRAFV